MDIAESKDTRNPRLRLSLKNASSIDFWKKFNKKAQTHLEKIKLKRLEQSKIDISKKKKVEEEISEEQEEEEEEVKWQKISAKKKEYRDQKEILQRNPYLKEKEKSKLSKEEKREKKEENRGNLQADPIIENKKNSKYKNKKNLKDLEDDLNNLNI